MPHSGWVAACTRSTRLIETVGLYRNLEVKWMAKDPLKVVTGEPMSSR
jgi:hypothetical protein